MRELSAADLRRIANRAGGGRVAQTYAQEMRSALYTAAEQLERVAGERAELVRLRETVELLSVGRLRAARAEGPLANGGTQ